MQQVKVGIVGLVNLKLSDMNAFQEDIKTLPDDGYRRLRTSILADSFAFAPHVFQDAEGSWWLLDGHQRYTALTMMAQEPEIELPSTFPCVEVTAESLEHARRLVLSGTSQYGVFSPKAVMAFAGKIGITPLQAVDRIALPGVDLTKLFKLNAGNGGSGEEEHVPPPSKNPITKLGDVILLGEHRLLCGDSTNQGDVDCLFTHGKKASLCFTSPPYADQREYGGGKELSTQHLAKFLNVAKNHVDLFAVNLGYSRKEGEVNPYWDDYIAEARRADLKFLSWNIWDRGAPGTVGQHSAMFPIEHEWIFVFGQEGRKLNLTVRNKTAGESSGRNRREADGTMIKRVRSVVRESRALGTVLREILQDKSRDANHPAKFPVELPECYIEACTSPGEFVYEPFAGSGTTCIAAQKLGRRCLMMEIDPGYCDVIVERWEKYTGLKAERLNARAPKV